MNAKPITVAEWWTLIIGAAVIILIVILMLYTGSVEPAASVATNATSTTSTAATLSTTAPAGGHSVDVAESGDTVTVNYTGMLSDGTVFDSSASHGQPFTFTLGVGQVIPGWDKGIVGMKVGDTKTLVIPPADAYGAKGVQNPSTGKYIIPPNATLTFQVQLISADAPAGQ
jgi:peptidylprolyl isomerase